MPAQRRSRPAAQTVQDKIRAELQLIRTHVAGVHGSLAATSDGLIVAHDVPDAEPTQIAALAAATLALASRATQATGCGSFREAVARGTDGYLAVYAAGNSAIVAVIGKSTLNVGMLQYRAREVIDRIAEYSAKIGAAAPPVPAVTARSPATPAGSPRGTGRTATSQLPRRRSAAS